jgi:hypothetical protein
MRTQFFINYFEYSAHELIATLGEQCTLNHLFFSQFSWNKTERKTIKITVECGNLRLISGSGRRAIIVEVFHSFAFLWNSTFNTHCHDKTRFPTVLPARCLIRFLIELKTLRNILAYYQKSFP